MEFITIHLRFRTRNGYGLWILSRLWIVIRWCVVHLVCTLLM